MKTWEIFSGLSDIVAYVHVAEGCTIYDTSYAALQLVRKQFPNNKNINGTQLLDVDRREKTKEDIPIFTLE